MDTANITFLRNRRGNGKIYDNSEVCCASVLDKFSEVKGDSSVWDSNIYNSRVINSTVTRTILRNCFAINSYLSGIQAEYSVFACELASTRSPIINSHILDHSRVTGFASCENVKFKNLTVCGTAQLKDWRLELDDEGNEIVFDGLKGYISAGVWERPPRVIRVGDMTITEGRDGFAYVGCRERRVSEWLERGKRLGKVFGMTETEISEVAEFLKTL